MREANSDQHHPPDSATVSLLSVGDVADTCALSRRAVYDTIKRGELPALRICSRLRVRPADLDRWLAGSSVQPIAPASATRAKRSNKQPASGSFGAQLRASGKARQ
ncbi:MAG TPA: helix-turn-helix domain-containing protein [Solirubrobacteraceae bacterium]|jgi:excisionase family DNA binding protein